MVLGGVLLGSLAKGFIGTLGGSYLVFGGGKYLYKKYVAPLPLGELLEEVTGKKFSRSTLVSYRNRAKGIVEFAYEIPTGLSIEDMHNLKPAIQDRFDCEVQVWVDSQNFIFELATNPIPKELVYNGETVKDILADYELGMYLGVSRKGHVVFDFTNNATPHLLFGGPTGKGKSNLLNQGICGIVERYSPEEVQIILIDLKDGVELGGYKNLPHVRAFYETTDEVIGGLELILAELKRRNELFKKYGAKKLSYYNSKTDSPLPRLLIIADEFAQFSNISDNDTRKLAYKKWEEVLQKGRSTGIHVMLGTQVTDADVFPRQIKGNIDARFGFSFSDPQHSKMITGGTELTNLPNIQGRGLFKLGDNMQQTQTPYISEEAVEELIEKYSIEKEEESLPIIMEEKEEQPEPAELEVLDIEDLFITEDQLKTPRS